MKKNSVGPRLTQGSYWNVIIKKVVDPRCNKKNN